MGWVLDELEKTGQIDNTLFIYTSDHGEMGGEHGLWLKNVLLEPAARVPLIMAGAGLPARQGGGYAGLARGHGGHHAGRGRRAQAARAARPLAGAAGPRTPPAITPASPSANRIRRATAPARS